jgi:glutamate transport system substrate-binding protein
MRHIQMKAVLAGLALAATAACGGNAGSDSGGGADVKVDDSAASSFEAGTQMKKLADAGKITIGVKFDQPGLGFKGAADKTPSGFDVEMGKILAGSLGIKAGDITWKETISDNREPFLQADEVDLVLATYSITDERRKVVGQAGPYYVTGQQLLVKKGSPIKSVADIKGKEVCSVTGSTSLDNVEQKGAKPRGFDTYSECRDQVLDGTVDSMTTDGSILLGYAAQNPDELEVVGDPFSEERYGVGYSKKTPEMCQWISDTITKSFEDGNWKKAFDATLGKSGADAPEQPELDPCPTA